MTDIKDFNNDIEVLIASLSQLGDKVNVAAMLTEKLQGAFSKKIDLISQLHALDKNVSSNKDKINDLQKAIDSAASEMEALSSALNKLNDAHKKNQEEVNKQYGAYNKLKGIMAQGASVMKEWGPMFGAQSITLKGAYDSVLKYNQSLYDLSRSYTMTGQGMGGLNAAFKDVASSTALSRKEFIDFNKSLMDAYAGLPPTIGQAQNLAKAFDKQLGPGAENAAKGIRSLKEVMSVMPALGRQLAGVLESIGKGVSIDSSGAKQSQGVLAMLYASGKISKEAFESSSKSLNKINSSEKERLKLNRENAKTAQGIADTTLKLGEQLSPAFEAVNKAMNLGLQVLSQYPAQIMGAVIAFKIMDVQIQKNIASMLKMRAVSSGVAPPSIGPMGPMGPSVPTRGGPTRGGPTRGRPMVGRRGGRLGALLSVASLATGFLSFGGSSEADTIPNQSDLNSDSHLSNAAKGPSKFNAKGILGKVGKGARFLGRGLTSSGFLAPIEGVFSGMSEYSERKNSENEEVRKSAGKAAVTKGATVTASVAGGAMAGAAIGTAIFPVIGTAIGGLIGGIAGGIGGNYGGEVLTDKLFGDENDISAIENAVGEVNDSLDDTASKVDQANSSMESFEKTTAAVALRVKEIDQNYAFAIASSQQYTQEIQRQLDISRQIYMVGNAGATYGTLVRSAETSVQENKRRIKQYGEEDLGGFKQQLSDVTGGKLPPELSRLLDQGIEAFSSIDTDPSKVKKFTDDGGFDRIQEEYEKFLSSPAFQEGVEIKVRANIEELKSVGEEISKLQAKGSGISEEEQSRLDTLIEKQKELVAASSSSGVTEGFASAGRGVTSNLLKMVNDLKKSEMDLAQSREQDIDDQARSNMELSKIIEDRVNKQTEADAKAGFGQGPNIRNLQKQVSLAKDQIKINQEQIQSSRENVKASDVLKSNASITVDELLRQVEAAESHEQIQSLINTHVKDNVGAQKTVVGHAVRYNQALGNIKDNQSKIVDLTKSVREGYLDAFNEMVVNAGDFEGIIPTQDYAVNEIMNMADLTEVGRLNTLKLGGRLTADQAASSSRSVVTGRYTADQGQPTLDYIAENAQNARYRDLYRYNNTNASDALVGDALNVSNTYLGSAAEAAITSYGQGYGQRYPDPSAAAARDASYNVDLRDGGPPAMSIGQAIAASDYALHKGYGKPSAGLSTHDSFQSQGDNARGFPAQDILDFNSDSNYNTVANGIVGATKEADVFQQDISESRVNHMYVDNLYIKQAIVDAFSDVAKSIEEGVAKEEEAAAKEEEKLAKEEEAVKKEEKNRKELNSLLKQEEKHAKEEAVKKEEKNTKELSKILKQEGEFALESKDEEKYIGEKSKRLNSIKKAMAQGERMVLTDEGLFIGNEASKNAPHEDLSKDAPTFTSDPALKKEEPLIQQMRWNPIKRIYEQDDSGYQQGLSYALGYNMASGKGNSSRADSSGNLQGGSGFGNWPGNGGPPGGGRPGSGFRNWDGNAGPPGGGSLGGSSGFRKWSGSGGPPGGSSFSKSLQPSSFSGWSGSAGSPVGSGFSNALQPSAFNSSSGSSSRPSVDVRLNLQGPIQAKVDSAYNMVTTLSRVVA